jgi:hypothetical protein
MTAPAVDDDSSTLLSLDGSRALLWLELVEGTARERLIERLAQAHLIEYGRAAARVDEES